MRRHLSLGQHNLQQTQEQIDVSAFAAILALVSDPERPLFLMSAATGRMLHGYFDLLTKRRSSPLLRYAKHALFVHTEAETLFKSRASMLVVLEAIISGMETVKAPQKNARLNEMEKLFRELDVYLNRDQI